MFAESKQFRRISGFNTITSQIIRARVRRPAKKYIIPPMTSLPARGLRCPTVERSIAVPAAACPSAAEKDSSERRRRELIYYNKALRMRTGPWAAYRHTGCGRTSAAVLRGERRVYIFEFCRTLCMMIKIIIIIIIIEKVRINVYAGLPAPGAEGRERAPWAGDERRGPVTSARRT